MLNKFIYSATFFFGLGAVDAQESNDSLKSNLSISGYIETYFNYDFNKPDNHKRPSFIYSHNRSNEISVNLAMIKASYNAERLRSNLALATGSYMNANYTAEEAVWKNVFEANIGYKLLENHNLWIDAGILPSHIGPESAIGLDNISLTRSLAAENSPYFETGAKLSYTTKDGKLYIAALALNGWQRIQLPNSNNGLSFGHQIQYKPIPAILINSSSYFGDEGNDSLRFFHDLYLQVKLTDKLNILTNWDHGIQKQPLIFENYHWWNLGFQTNYALTSSLKLNARIEYFNDNDGVIFGKFNDWGTNILGYSAGLDLDLYKGLIWRTEFKNLKSADNVFFSNNEIYKENSSTLITSLGWRF